MRRHLTPSLAISIIALFVALGGVSYAAIKLPANSVGAAQSRRTRSTQTKSRIAHYSRPTSRPGNSPAARRALTALLAPLVPLARRARQGPEVPPGQRSPLPTRTS